MKPLFLFLFLMFMSCSDDKGKNLVGSFRNGLRTYKINEAGDLGFFIQYDEDYTDKGSTYSSSTYSTFKDGCFYIKVGKEEEPILCKKGNQLISLDGTIYYPMN